MITQILTVYVITLIICSSSILDPPRQWLISKTPGLYSPFARFFSKYQYSAEAKHFVECRMCTGVWISVLVCIFYHSLAQYSIVFGVSYFMTTQER